MFDEIMEKKLPKEWENFVQNNTCNENNIRPQILNSWKRSKRYGVNPYEIKDKILTITELNSKINNKKSLINVTSSYINKIYSFVKGSGFVIYLTDEDGNILSLVGDDGIVASANSYSSLCLGANRSERYAGTNAIATSLAIDEPIQVYGPEHWVKYHQKYACSAAPIHDENKNIIGCLDITGIKEYVHSHTLGMIVAAVDGIEKELKIINAYNKIFIMNSQLSTTLNSINSAIIVISKDGTMLSINKSASTIFSLGTDCIDKKINSVLKYNNRIINFEKLNKNYMDVELEIQSVNYSITTANYSNKYDQIEGTVISFREMKRIHKIVNRLSGFTATYTIDNLIGSSSQINYLKKMCLKASKSISNVLILGESGTGKELVAQSIHNASSRKNEPFIAINCGALPKDLIESELFGYEGGSFTGANKEGKPGKFELADGGTIFLDEIGDMPLDTQVNLLRVLEDKKIVRIGGNKPKPINIRVIAATNKDLFKCIHSNTFREDLYYRLNVFTVNIPPLRERKIDIKALIDHFINHYNIALNKKVVSINNDALDALTNYSWPGNVRELENVIERAINIVDSDVITIKDLPYEFQCTAETDSCNNKNRTETSITPDLRNNKLNKGLSNVKADLEKEELINALTISRGNVAKASEQLRINRRTLYRKLDKYDILLDKFR